MAIDDRVKQNQVLGSVSWGENRTKIFFRLCEVYKNLGLDIIDVESHVSQGWFTKMILAKYRGEADFELARLSRGINKVSKDLGFQSRCFAVPDSARTSDSESNVVIVVQADNKTGLLAEILDLLDEFNVDIIDIRIFMNEKESSFALNLQVFVPVDEEGFFSDLQKLRQRLHSFRRQPGLETFNYLVHSSETFDFIEKIDYETEV